MIDLLHESQANRSPRGHPVLTSGPLPFAVHPCQSGSSVMERTAPRLFCGGTDRSSGYCTTSLGPTWAGGLHRASDADACVPEGCTSDWWAPFDHHVSQVFDECQSRPMEQDIKRKTSSLAPYLLVCPLEGTISDETVERTATIDRTTSKSALLASIAPRSHLSANRAASHDYGRAPSCPNLHARSVPEVWWRKTR